MGTLRRGSRGQDVRDLQRMLSQLGDLDGPVDGIFGAQTEAAVRSFQRRRRLVDDGIVGPRTWAQIAEVLSSDDAQPARLEPDGTDDHHQAVRHEDRDCATYEPGDDGSLVVATREFAPPNGLQVTNWASSGVFHYTPNHTDCRAPGAVDEIVVHETLTDDWPIARQRRLQEVGPRLSVQLALLPDGTLYQHMDLVQRAHHAAPHNERSLGIEVVKRHIPRNDADPDKVLDTRWADLGRRAADGSWQNPRRRYQLPTEDQARALHTVVEWITGDEADHDLGVPAAFPGVSEDHYVFFPFDQYRQRGGDHVPGIYAHGHIGGPNRHIDGLFLTLYLWLRMQSGQNHDEAWQAAQDLASNATFGNVKGIDGDRPIVDLSEHL